MLSISTLAFVTHLLFAKGSGSSMQNIPDIDRNLPEMGPRTGPYACEQKLTIFLNSKYQDIGNEEN